MTFLNRSRFEIMADILQRAVTGAKKTWLLYSANLSYSQHQKYISTLVELGLLLKNNGLYTTTQKGMDFITSYQKLTSLLGETFSMTAEAKRELAKKKSRRIDGALSVSGNDDVETEVLDTTDD
ncbi:winged helix-turn-helix domain-containing protein [Candidatus Bathyarchaeota archaeon]|nr:winged helix-turn-helix domain-containing protein [Candidatus Bathyarchaeota archaeon]